MRLDVAARQRMFVLRGVKSTAPILRADADAQPVADPERHLAHAPRRRRRERLVDRRPIERVSGIGASQYSNATTPMTSHCMAGRFSHAGPPAARPSRTPPGPRAPCRRRPLRAARHPGVGHQRHEAREQLRQLEAGVEPGDGQEGPQRPRQKDDRHGAPEAHVAGPRRSPPRAANNSNSSGTMPSPRRSPRPGRRLIAS